MYQLELILFCVFVTALVAPNPKCIVCAAKPEAFIKIDTKRVTIKQFRDDVLIKALNMVEPDVEIDGKGVIVISSDGDETEENNDKLLSDMNIIDGCILKVDDFFQQYELRVIISHRDVEREGNLFDVIADPDTLKAKESNEAVAPSASEDTAGTSEGQPIVTKVVDDDDDDDLVLIEDDESAMDESTTPKKRRPESNDDEPQSKRSKNQTSVSPLPPPPTTMFISDSSDDD